MGIPIGIPIALVLGNIALGPAIGAGIGLVIGTFMEKRNNPNPRPLTKKEESIFRMNLIIATILGIVVFSIVIIQYFYITQY